MGFDRIRLNIDTCNIAYCPYVSRYYCLPQNFLTDQLDKYLLHVIISPIFEHLDRPLDVGIVYNFVTFRCFLNGFTFQHRYRLNPCYPLSIFRRVLYETDNFFTVVYALELLKFPIH